MSDRPPPDFAMLRAVEILAKMHQRLRSAPNTPPPPIDRPVVLRSDRISFAIGTTTRSEVERELGIAFSYPARGWHTYASQESGKTCLLSAFYRKSALVAVELYVPRGANTLPLAPRNLGGFTLEPGGVAIGMNPDAITQTFTPAVGGPANVVYDRAFEARFPGGVAYAMAKGALIERLAMYADNS